LIIRRRAVQGKQENRAKIAPEAPSARLCSAKPKQIFRQEPPRILAKMPPATDAIMLV
jgi:hypothetical protein